MEFGKSYPSTNSWLSKLYIQISILHMSVVPGPASQDIVIKRVLVSPGLQCGDIQFWQPGWSSIFSLFYCFKKKLRKSVLLERRHRNMWNHFASISLNKYFWRHCPLQMSFFNFVSTLVRCLSEGSGAEVSLLTFPIIPCVFRAFLCIFTSGQKTQTIFT
jgi:hypothetical protein